MVAALACLLAVVPRSDVKVFATPEPGWPRRVSLLRDMKSSQPFSVGAATARLWLEANGRRVGPRQSDYPMAVGPNDRSVAAPGTVQQTRLACDLDRRGVPSGIYSLRGEVRLRLRRAARVWTQTKAIAPVSLSLPPEGRVARGRYLFAGGYLGFVPRGGNGRSLEIEPQLLREWRVAQVRREGTLYAVEGTPGEILLPNGPQHALMPLVDDAEVEALRRQYLNRLVWMPGGTWARGLGSDPDFTSIWEAPLDQPARVRGIYRVSGIAGLAGGRLGEATRFLALDPLYVVLELPKAATLTHGWVDYRARQDPDLAREPSAYSAFYVMAAGAWDLERLMTPNDPFASAAHVGPRADWDAFDRDLRRGNVRLGMTPDLVAWARGWPASLEPLDRLRRQSVWRYKGTHGSETYRFAASTWQPRPVLRSIDIR